MSALRLFSLRNITILIYIVLLFLGVYIYLAIHAQSNPKIQKITGSSQYAALDIVSGDVSKSARDQVLDIINSVAPENISWQDAHMTSASYHKTYQTGSSSTITFSVTLPKLKTAYNIGVYNQASSEPQVSVFCSVNQPAGYGCNYPIVGGE